MLNIPNLSTRQIACLIAIRDHGSLSGAAVHLGYSQSQLSRILAEIESELGFTIFHRTRSGVEFTEIGAELLPRLADWSNELRDVLNRSREAGMGLTGNLSLGYSSICFAGPARRVAHLVRQRLPQTTLNLTTGRSGSLIERVLRKDLDGAICHPPALSGDFRSLSMGLETWDWCVGDQWIDAGKTSLDYLATVPILVPPLQQWASLFSRLLSYADANQVRVNLVTSPVNAYDVLLQVEAGFGMSLLPRSWGLLGHPGVTFLPSDPDARLQTETAFVVRTDARSVVTRLYELLAE
jgi:DNA-binding transcriptional LysR family regulator